MSLDYLFAGFLPHVAIGAGTVLGLFLIAWLVIPRRTAVNTARRITK